MSILNTLLKNRSGFKIEKYISLNKAEKKVISKIENGNQLGFVVKGLFSKQLCDNVIKFYEAIPKELIYQFANNSGESFPISFASLLNQSIEDKKTALEFFKKLSVSFSQSMSNFEVDLNQLLLDQLKKVDQEYSFQIPVIKENSENIPLNGFSIRKIFPNSGGLKYHVGDSFKEFYSSFFNITNIPLSAKQLSFFIVLQPAEKGGNLKIYNATYPEYKELNENRWLHSKKKKKKLDAFYNEEIIFEQGDLFVFDGGKFWHEVTEPKGKLPRYTLGGFLSLTKNNAKVWA